MRFAIVMTIPFLIVLIVNAGCCAICYDDDNKESIISIKQLLLASTEVDTKICTLYIHSAGFGRNMMPTGCYKSGCSVVNVDFVSSVEEMLDSFIPTTIWCIYLEEYVWEINNFQIDELHTMGLKMIQLFAREGPRWEVGESVDIVIKLKNENDNSEYFLKIEDRIISAAL